MEENTILNAFVDGANNSNTENTEKTEKQVTKQMISEKFAETAQLISEYLLSTEINLSSQKLAQLLKLRRAMINFRAEN